MARKTKNTLIQAKLESTIGQDATPGATDTLLVSDASHEIVYRNVDRNLIRPTMGHSGSLVGTRHVKIDFTCELAPSGAAGTAPAWGRLLQACAFAEVVTPNERVEYNPVSAGFKTLTIKYSADGVIHTALGCMGTVAFSLPEGERPTLKFSFIGVDAGPAAAATPGSNLTAWTIPEVVNAQNTGKLTFGATLAQGALSGGTEYCSRGLELDMANDAKYLALLGCTGVDITDRKPSGNCQIELTGAQEVAMRGEINANTPTSISLRHGSGAGKQVILHAPRCLRLNPKEADYEGIRLLGMEFNAEPIQGNDEVHIVCL